MIATVWLRRVVLVAGLVLGVAAAGLVAPASAAPPPLPTADPFYEPDGPLDDRAPGAILKTRVVQLGYENQGLPMSATQLLYRTTDQFGQPSATVTTIVTPAGSRPGTPRRVVSYHAYYDALGTQCDPSYALRGANSQNPPVDLAMIVGLINAGYTVTIPDYEGEKLRWTMGLESGRAALDGVRATLRHLRAPASTPVGLYGYSGGSIPTGFGAEIAPQYAPELNIVGAAAGGVLVNPEHNLGYVNGSPKWAGVIPALMTVYNETYDLDLARYLSPRGFQVLAQVRGECIGDFASNYPGLTDAAMLKPAVGSLLNVPGMRAAAAENVMGSTGTPRAPMFLGVGNSDGRGDGIMLTGDVAALSASYCRRGVASTFEEYAGLDHTESIAPWTANALIFLNKRFSGQVVDGCR